MSNTPIFDQLARERNYRYLVDPTSTSGISGFFGTRIHQVAAEPQGLSPDPYLDGQYYTSQASREVVSEPSIGKPGRPKAVIEPSTFGRERLGFSVKPLSAKQETENLSGGLRTPLKGSVSHSAYREADWSAVTIDGSQAGHRPVPSWAIKE